MHPVNHDIRLAKPAVRLYRRFFQPEDPLGWADYHCVEQPGGGYWIHTHGLRRWKLPELEFVHVPGEMTDDAHQLMFAVVEACRATGSVEADADIDRIRSTPGQKFSQMVTLRPSFYKDKRHGNILRIVDRDRPAEEGFPVRLFAAHVVACAEGTGDAAQREEASRRALAIFPGYFLEMTAGGEVDPRKPDFTDLQQRANLSAYLLLADALAEQKRPDEAIDCLEAAIARCPGWGQNQREYLTKKYRRKDDVMNFWRGVDIAEVCMRRRPANTTGPLPGPKTRKRRPAAGAKARNPERSA